MIGHGASERWRKTLALARGSRNRASAEPARPPDTTSWTTDFCHRRSDHRATNLERSLTVAPSTTILQIPKRRRVMVAEAETAVAALGALAHEHRLAAYRLLVE